MAVGVRRALAVDGVPASIGLSTTGVAGPDSQDGHPVGTVFLGLAHGADVRTTALALTGTRNEIRRAVVEAALRWLAEELGLPAGRARSQRRAVPVLRTSGGTVTRLHQRQAVRHEIFQVSARPDTGHADPFGELTRGDVAVRRTERRRHALQRRRRDALGR